MGGPTQPPELIYRGEVPHIPANFDKTRQRTLLDDLPGGDPPNMKKYKKLRENTSKMLSLRSKIPGVEWDPPPIDRDHREAGVEWAPSPL